LGIMALLASTVGRSRGEDKDARHTAFGSEGRLEPLPVVSL
jgi:hypothetical protein